MSRRSKRIINGDVGPCMWYMHNGFCSVEGGEDDCEYYVDGECTKYKSMNVIVEERRIPNTSVLTELVLVE